MLGLLNVDGSQECKSRTSSYPYGARRFEPSEVGTALASVVRSMGAPQRLDHSRLPPAGNRLMRIVPRVSPATISPTSIPPFASPSSLWTNGQGARPVKSGVDASALDDPAHGALQYNSSVSVYGTFLWLASKQHAVGEASSIPLYENSIRIFLPRPRKTSCSSLCGGRAPSGRDR